MGEKAKYGEVWRGGMERKIGLNGVALDAFDTDKDGKQSRFWVGRKMVRVGVGVSSFLVFSEFCFWGSWGRGVCVGEEP